MAAYMWNANPGKWNVAPPLSAWDALREYVVDPCNYVYWSTPQLQKHIQVGDAAFIWRTQHGKEVSGIIAVGRVEEVPRQLSPATLGLFAFPQRVQAAGWSETSAPLLWKTGICIEQVFWNTPLQVTFRASQGTLRRLDDREVQEAENAIKTRTK